MSSKVRYLPNTLDPLSLFDSSVAALIRSYKQNTVKHMLQYKLLRRTPYSRPSTAHVASPRKRRLHLGHRTAVVVSRFRSRSRRRAAPRRTCTGSEQRLKQYATSLPPTLQLLHNAPYLNRISRVKAGALGSSFRARGMCIYRRRLPCTLHCIETKH